MSKGLGDFSVLFLRMKRTKPPFQGSPADQKGFEITKCKSWPLLNRIEGGAAELNEHGP